MELFRRRTVDSTMTEAFREYRKGRLTHLGAVYALHQRQGRGRFPERRWDDRRGQSLLMTVVLESRRLAFSPQRLPLIAGVAAARLLSEWGLSACIRWPNDLLVKDKKICGILCHYHALPNDPPIVLCGIGLNLNEKKVTAKSPYRTEATSVFRETGKRRSVQGAAFRLQQLLAEAVAEEAAGEGSVSVDGVNRRLWGIHSELSFTVGSDGAVRRTVRGRLVGVGSDGRVRLQAADGTVTEYVSGEFSSR